MTEGLLPCWKCFKEGAQMYTARSKFYITTSFVLIAAPLLRIS